MLKPKQSEGGIHKGDKGFTGTKTAQATPRVGVVVCCGFLGPQWAEKDTFLRDEKKGQGKKGDIK